MIWSRFDFACFKASAQLLMMSLCFVFYCIKNEKYAMKESFWEICKIILVKLRFILYLKTPAFRGTSHLSIRTLIFINWKMLIIIHNGVKSSWQAVQCSCAKWLGFGSLSWTWPGFWVSLYRFILNNIEGDHKNPAYFVIKSLRSTPCLKTLKMQLT